MDPTVMNGAVMKNFVTSDTPFASALVGSGHVFVSEVDESDGSIALYEPRIAVLNNITLDHKSMDELRALFLSFAGKAETAVLNLDDDETRLLAQQVDPERLVTFSFHDESADFFGSDIVEEPLAISFIATGRSNGETAHVLLQVPGRHNAANALAALAASRAAGLDLQTAAAALAGFKGLRRRFEVVGTANDITVIDDFGHNPDKIGATLDTLHAFPGRVLVMFQPHGYGPLRAMGRELIDCFATKLGEEDILIMPDPVYYGGTVERTIGSGDIVAGVRSVGRNAEHIPDRADCGKRLLALATPGDRIVIMGARDDTLSQFAAELSENLG
jgi:UDP-N-acetylmuramate--alanine ligase